MTRSNLVADAIDRKVEKRAMLNHPFYRAWTDGTLSIASLSSYARQYFHHVDAFPRAVSAVHSNCPHSTARRMLAENLADEEGIGAGKQPHAQLWLEFASELGDEEAEVRTEKLNPETTALIDTFDRLARKSYASGLGALYAYESQFPSVSRAKIDGLIKRYRIDSERALRFFRVHESVDVEHSDVCRQLLGDLPLDEQAEAVVAGEELAGALWTFLSGVVHAEGPTTH